VTLPSLPWDQINLTAHSSNGINVYYRYVLLLAAVHLLVVAIVEVFVVVAVAAAVAVVAVV
jgi:hypothetical protein